ncbi:hypothetical protein ACR76E_10355 [Thomasclavelia ramosa]|uniref:hypothetical protein n=1 Tax=Thomasclavelia ramosa TaxID=1547 RepID=UPI003DA411E3
MIEVKRTLFPISIIAVGVGAFTIPILNRNKLKNLEEEIESTRDDVKSVLRYQEQKNALIDSELEGIRDEVASCYEHFEAFSKEKEDGR